MVVTYPEHDPALPVVVFDFDGVLAKNTWPLPYIGEPIWEAFDAVKHYQSLGCEIVVCTARPDEHLPKIRKWLDDQGVGRLIYEVTNKKPTASLYIDDRAVKWPL